MYTDTRHSYAETTSGDCISGANPISIAPQPGVFDVVMGDHAQPLTSKPLPPLPSIRRDKSGATAPTDELLPLTQYGALPWRVGRCGNLRILLVTSRRRGRWIVPKGWPMVDRSPSKAAMQEALEEAGVIGQISSTPFGSFEYLKTRSNGSEVPCRVDLFGLRVRGTLLQWREKDQRSRRWCSLAEAIRFIDEPDLKRLLSRVEFCQSSRTLTTVAR